MSTQAPEQARSATSEVVAAVLAVAALYLAGKITAETYARIAAAHIYAAKVIAARSADILVSTWASRRPVGITPPRTELTRLEAALLTIAEDPDAFLTRSERIAVSEPAHEERRALQEAMREQGFRQWRRVVQEDACEECRALAGKVYDIEEGFRDHPNCACTLEPYGEPGTAEEPEEPARLIRFSKSVTIR